MSTTIERNVQIVNINDINTQASKADGRDDNDVAIDQNELSAANALRTLMDDKQKSLENLLNNTPTEELSGSKALNGLLQSVGNHIDESSLESLLASVLGKRAELSRGMIREQLETNKQRNGDLANIREGMAALRVLVAGKKDEEDIDIGDVVISPDPDSGLGQANEEFQNLLRHDPEMKALLARYNWNPEDVRVCTVNGLTGSLYNTKTGTFLSKGGPSAWKDSPIAQKLRDLANSIGGANGAYGNGTIKLSALLEYYGINPADPKNVAEAHAAIEGLKGKSETLSANSQTEMMAIQKSMNDMNETIQQRVKAVGDLHESKQGILR